MTLISVPIMGTRNIEEYLKNPVVTFNGVQLHKIAIIKDGKIGVDEAGGFFYGNLEWTDPRASREGFKGRLTPQIKDGKLTGITLMPIKEETP